MNLNLRRLQAFLAVSECRSFTRAAETLGLSQPAVSARVKELEDEIGLKLFSRTTRFVQPTPDGEKLLLRARRAVEELEAAVLDLQDVAALRRGYVSVACVPAVAARLVPQAIGRFAVRHPAVRVEFAELTSAEVEAQVLDGVADLGICGRTARHADLDLEVVARDPFVALVPADHELARYRSVTLGKLRAYPLIALRRGSNVRATIERAFSDAGVPFEPSFETTHHYSLVGMVAADLGVGALPLMALSALRCDGLKTVAISDPAIEREIGIVTRRGIAVSPAASELIQLLRVAVRDGPHAPAGAEMRAMTR